MQSVQLAVSEIWVTLILCAILYLFRNELKWKRVTRVLVVVCIVRLVSDAVSWALDGVPGAVCGAIATVSNYVTFVSNDLVSIAFSVFIWGLVKRGDEKPDLVLKAYWALEAVAICALTLNVPFGWFYTIDAANEYVRGDCYRLTHVAPIAALLVVLWLLLKYRNRLGRNQMVMGWSYLVGMAAATAYEFTSFGLSLQAYAQTFSALMALFVDEIDLRHDLLATQEKLERTNAELKGEERKAEAALQAEERKTEIISAIAAAYKEIVVLDFQTRSYHVLSEHKGSYRAAGTAGAFEQLVQAVFRAKLASDYDDNEEVRAFLDLDTVQARLRDKNAAVMELKTKADTWYSAGFLANRRDGEGNVVDCLFVVRDIGEQKRRELKKDEALREQLAIFNALADAYENVFFIDVDNETAKVLKLDGYVISGLKRDSKEDHPYTAVLSRYIDERVHPDDKDMLRRAIGASTVRRALEDSNEYIGTYRILVDGETHYYQYKYIKMEKAGYVIAGFQNVDRIVEAEKKQQDQLSLALAAAQQASKAKTMFLNSMSHDIRTPMNAIIGFTALAQTHISNTEQVQDYLSKIATSSTHLLSLINDILDMSRIESGSVKLDEKPVHLPDLLHDLRTMIQGLINSKQQNLYIDAQDVCHEDVITDKLRLNQVLINIVGNAIKFTPAGGDIIVHLVEKPCLMHGHATYEISIKDNGIGMSAQFMEHVFDTFSRERSSTVSGIQGTGLGMAITKNIVEMMGGTIGVESEEGKGSKFTVTLTLRLASQVIRQEPIPELRGARALVADDDTDTCRNVCKMLRSIGMQPDWTSSGKEAVLRAQDASELHDEYKVYIVDYLMPDMNGIETVRRIRRVIREDVPIIVLTAYDWAEFEQEAREAGVTAFVAKPIFMSELRSVLTQPAQPQSPAAEGPVMPCDYSGKRVLLVEDNELNREIASTILRETGMQVDCAEDGIEAVNAVSEAPEDTYDLVLMDIQMPRMDGYTAAREIRTLPNNRKANIPIVAMTANAFDEDRRKSFECGMNGHIVKPIDVKAVAATLDRVFREAAR